jgi:hypothetical protein
LAKPLQQVPPDCATIAMRAKVWGIGYTAANRRLVAMEEAGQVEKLRVLLNGKYTNLFRLKANA